MFELSRWNQYKLFFKGIGPRWRHFDLFQITLATEDCSKTRRLYVSIMGFCFRFSYYPMQKPYG